MTALSACSQQEQQQQQQDPKTYLSQSTRCWVAGSREGAGSRPHPCKGRWKLINFNCYELAGGEPFLFTHQAERATSPAFTWRGTQPCLGLISAYAARFPLPAARCPLSNCAQHFPQGAFGCSCNIVAKSLATAATASVSASASVSVSGVCDCAAWLAALTLGLLLTRLGLETAATWLPSCACQERGGLFIHNTHTHRYVLCTLPLPVV